MIAPRITQARTPTGEIGHKASPTTKVQTITPMTARRSTGSDLVAQLSHIDIERRLEEQRRQKDVEEQLGAEPEILEPAHDIADDAPGVRRRTGGGQRRR